MPALPHGCATGSRRWLSTSPTDPHLIEQLQMMRFSGENWKMFGPVLDGRMAK